MLFPEKK